MSMRNVSNWGVSDDDIRHMSPELRQRIRDYEEQRREGQTLMHKLAHPPEEDILETSPDHMGFPERLQTHLTVISFQLLIIIAALSIIAVELK